MNVSLVFRANIATALLCASFGTIVALTAIAPARAGGTVATVAKSAPKFLLETPSGGSLTLADFAGKPLVINAFASWCPPCRLELPLLAATARRERNRVAFLGVDEQEANEIATTFARSMRLPFVIGLDKGQFAASYGATSLPVTIFIDARGTVRAIQHGAIDAPTLARDLQRIAPTAPGART
jgi:thiol-disulfide isomerase/thioredoxin